MRNADRTTKSPFVVNGLFATLSGLLPGRGSGAPSVRLTVATSLIALGSLFALTAAPAAAEPCPNESLREAHGEAGLALPDCRAYEQASPVNKSHNDALGFPEWNAVASASGSAIGFYSQGSFPVAESTHEGLATEYVSTRVSAPSWVTRGVLPPAVPDPLLGLQQTYGFTQDLSKAIYAANEPLQAPGALPHTVSAYVRDNATGASQLIATAPNYALQNQAGFEYIGASSDGRRIFFQTTAQLLPEAAPGHTNLFEWNEARPESERLSLAGVLTDSECAALSRPPGCAPPAGSSSAAAPGANSRAIYQQGVVSVDGSRVLFADPGSGRLYMRLTEIGETIPVSPGPARWLAATPDGRYVFFSEGEDLYRFNTANEHLLALTAGAEGIPGSLGVSADGAYAYFVAPGVLATNENANEEVAANGSGNTFVNLYLWHQGSGVSFIARLKTTAFGQETDLSDWADSRNGTPGQGRGSRLSRDGTVLLFSSIEQLTAYPNQGHRELYLYDANHPFSSANPVCVSCDPAGLPPVGPAVPSNEGPLGQGARGSLPTPTRGPPLVASLARNLSANGDRVFFETVQSLLPADRNELDDVYEWERPGLGSCLQSSPAYSAQDGGCLYLISTGTSHEGSSFAGASESGDDVFFFTVQPLVGADTDDSFDVYDARENGGIAAQNPSPAPICAAESCKPPLTEPPVEPSAATASFHGPPNPEQPRCRRGFVRRHGHCVKKHRRRHHKGSHKRAGRNSGGHR